MGRTRAWPSIVFALVPAIACAQPTLDLLWPNADGLRWDYQFNIQDRLNPASFTTDAVMILAGTAETACGPGQVLHGSHELPPFGTVQSFDPLLRRVWRARPDLHPALASQYGSAPGADVGWRPLLLHDGYFIKTETSIRMAQPANSNCPTWTYLTSALSVGATFTQQLVPDLADDVFLHGTVEAIDAVVSTFDTTFTDAVRMRYVIDYGWSECVDAGGEVVGRSRHETQGHVHYVPDVGPVDLLEEFIHVERDGNPTCPDPAPPWAFCCFPLGIIDTITMSLHGPVEVEPTYWTTVKRLYR